MAFHILSTNIDSSDYLLAVAVTSHQEGFCIFVCFITVGGDYNFAMVFTSLTIGGFAQPLTATNIIVIPGNAEKGLSQRFLWVCPEPKFLEYDSLGNVDQTFYEKSVRVDNNLLITA